MFEAHRCYYFRVLFPEVKLWYIALYRQHPMKSDLIRVKLDMRIRKSALNGKAHTLTLVRPTAKLLS